VIYREFFPRGLTALDDLDARTLGMRPSLSHATARYELLSLLDTLRLPLDERARQRSLAQAEWLASRDKPLELDNVIAE
jgi:chromosome partitioning protein